MKRLVRAKNSQTGSTHGDFVSCGVLVAVVLHIIVFKNSVSKRFLLKLIVRETSVTAAMIDQSRDNISSSEFPALQLLFYKYE